MNQLAEKQNYPDDEIDLRELFLTLWRGKWLIIATTIVFAVAGLAYALYKPDIYQANVLLAPAKEEADGLGGMASQLGGLASLAGISLGGSGSNQTVIAKEILQSRKFLTDFIQRHNLAKPLMAVEGWRTESNEWIYDEDVYDPKREEWLVDGTGESHKPTTWELVEAMRKDHFRLSESKETGMITVSIQHYSPSAARKWSEWLVEDINEYMRNKDVSEAEARIDYLQTKLQETNVAGMQQVFYQLIENETRTVMLANAQQEYVFKTIDPAVIPEEKVSPNRSLIIVLATLMGGITGALIVFIGSYVQPSRTKSSGQ
tara:strand:- start:24467 stop:25417 length:951 start_codon:yes stop_codon:yes gene_type:complete